MSEIESGLAVYKHPTRCCSDLWIYIYISFIGIILQISCKIYYRKQFHTSAKHMYIAYNTTVLIFLQHSLLNSLPSPMIPSSSPFHWVLTGLFLCFYRYHTWIRLSNVSFSFWLILLSVTLFPHSPALPILSQKARFHLYSIPLCLYTTSLFTHLSLGTRIVSRFWQLKPALWWT